jgi:hypothetical protein
VQGLGLIQYWLLVSVISAVVHPIVYRHARSTAVVTFLVTCLVISSVCGALNLADLLVRTQGQVKPGWAYPLLIAGTGAAFPAALAAGLLFHLVRVCACRYALRKARHRA